LVERASAAGLDNDKQGFLEAVLTAIVKTPDADGKTKNVATMRKFANLLGLPYSTGSRILNKASAKRSLMKVGNKDVLWSSVASCKGCSEFSNELKAEVFDWIIGHKNVRESPIKGDEKWIIDGAGERVRAQKCLLEISNRELHDDLINRDPAAGPPSVWKSDGPSTHTQNGNSEFLGVFAHVQHSVEFESCLLSPVDKIKMPQSIADNLHLPLVFLFLCHHGERRHCSALLFFVLSHSFLVSCITSCWFVVIVLTIMKRLDVSNCF
jgi:hypothetical protein